MVVPPVGSSAGASPSSLRYDISEVLIFRRDCRDAVSARRAGAHRRDLRVCCASSAARREKPRVSAFTWANIGKILALKPDLVLTISDLQADIVADLIRRGLNVHAFNQRTVAGIFAMIRMLGAIVDAGGRAEELVRTLEARLTEARIRAERLPQRPKVFFEEWNNPLISGIGWVSELIEIADGIDLFTDRRYQGAARDRVVTADEVVAGNRI